jgi:hypothetical protein
MSGNVQLASCTGLLLMVASGDCAHIQGLWNVVKVSSVQEGGSLQG